MRFDRIIVQGIDSFKKLTHIFRNSGRHRFEMKHVIELIILILSGTWMTTGFGPKVEYPHISSIYFRRRPRCVFRNKSGYSIWNIRYEIFLHSRRRGLASIMWKYFRKAIFDRFMKLVKCLRPSKWLFWTKIIELTHSFINRIPVDEVLNNFWQ